MSLCAILLVLSAAVLMGCAVPPAEPTACDGLAEKTMGITKQDYSTCAGEILEALQEFETRLRPLVNGNESARQEAQAAYSTLRHLMGQVGFQADVFREVGGGAGRTVERWPDSSMRSFNHQVTTAATQFRAALSYPNHDNFQQGRREHAAARQTYWRFR